MIQLDRDKCITCPRPRLFTRPDLPSDSWTCTVKTLVCYVSEDITTPATVRHRFRGGGAVRTFRDPVHRAAYGKRRSSTSHRKRTNRRSSNSSIRYPSRPATRPVFFSSTPSRSSSTRSRVEVYTPRRVPLDSDGFRIRLDWSWAK